MSVPNSNDAMRDGKARGYLTVLAVLGLLIVVGLLIGVRSLLDRTTGAAVADGRTFALTPHEPARRVAAVAFEDGNGRRLTLEAFRGKAVLLNVWATWCIPCREEMPTLDRLQSQLGGSDFEVVALSIDRGGVAAVKSFYDEIDVRALAVYVDSTVEAQGLLHVIGIPTTLLVDREGMVVAHYVGPAKWDRREVVEEIRRYVATSNSIDSRNRITSWNSHS